ncbi:MAG: hypothetical protein JXQ29_07305 [Planctomycetes bacterium]|nr:hypothetical protein [Planctomycetota bacterium]
MLAKRLAQVLVLFGVANLLVIAHLVRLQVVERDAWVAKGEDHRTRRLFSPPIRGSIRLEGGAVVARSEHRFDLRIEPGRVRDRWPPAALAAALGKLEAKQGFWLVHGREAAERAAARAALAAQLETLEREPGGVAAAPGAGAEDRRAELAERLAELDRAHDRMLEAEIARRARHLAAIVRDPRAEWDRLLAAPIFLVLGARQSGARAGTVAAAAPADREECPLDGSLAAQLDAVLGGGALARVQAFVREPRDGWRPLRAALGEGESAALEARYERLAGEAQAFRALAAALGDDLEVQLWRQVVRAEDGARRELQAAAAGLGRARTSAGDSLWWLESLSRLGREARMRCRKILRDHLGRERTPARSVPYDVVVELHRASVDRRLQGFAVQEYSDRRWEQGFAPHLVGWTGEVPAAWLEDVAPPDPLDPDAVLGWVPRLQAVARWRIEALQRRILSQSGMRSREEARAFVALEEALLARPHVGDRDVGIEGIERRYDERLRGRRGILRFVHVPGARRPLVIHEAAAVDGADVTLTLDEALQRQAEALLAADRARRQGAEQHVGMGGGALVALDPRCGAVRVLATDPSYEPRALREPGALARLADRRQSPDRPLASRALEPALPGSVFKIFTALVGLEHGVIQDEHTAFSCWGRLPGGPTPGCAYAGHAGGAASVDFHEALCHSCNAYFAKVARALHERGLRDAFDRTFRAFHFDQPPLWGDDAARYAGRIRMPASEAEMRNMAIGQDPVYVSPLHLAVLYAAVAQRGLWRPPFVVEQSPYRQGAARRAFPAAHAELLVTGMQHAVRRGTAQHEGFGRLAERGIAVAGKTGTATFGSRRQPSALPRHAWFAGFAPADRPEIVVVVYLEHRGLSGGAAAVPLAADFLEHYFGTARPAEGTARR